MSNQSDHRLNLEENSKYRVAWDMAKFISQREPEPKQDREYLLRLTRQCIKSLDPYYSIEEVVTGKKDQSMGIRI
jgi:hypothetical protein